jgi:hypothetical protein
MKVYFNIVNSFFVNLIIKKKKTKQLLLLYLEYETALCRWAVECSKSEFIPPHPRQLANLLSITTAKERIVC